MRKVLFVETTSIDVLTIGRLTLCEKDVKGSSKYVILSKNFDSAPSRVIELCKAKGY